MKEKISVIVPIYNVEIYLDKCIKSIIEQTYKNLEILLIDDGATDNSGAICDKYAALDDRIRVIHKANEGVSLTKNLGIDISTGKYISFVDGDDYIEPEYFELLYNNMIEQDADISILSYNVVREDGSHIEGAVTETDLKNDEIVVYEGQDIIKELLKQKTVKNFVCKLYKKDVMKYFPVGVTYEDIVFSFEVLNAAKKVVYMNTRKYNYLKRRGSITAIVSEKNLNDFAKAMYDRFVAVNKCYPSLLEYNMYAFLESTVALSIKNVISGRQYLGVNEAVERHIEIIKTFVEQNEQSFFELLNDYQKLCVYLMKYNTELYYTFLKERQNLKIQGKIK